jgi:hypothetical protein
MDDARRDLATIKQAIEDGRLFAESGGGYMLIWGGAIGLAEFATYAAVRGWLPWLLMHLGAMWPICISLAWVATVLLIWRQCRVRRIHSLAGRALGMTWLGCGVTLSILYLSTVMTGGFEPGWFLAVVAGTMGIGFFASSYLCAYRWMRAVAVAWWLSEAAFFSLRADAEILVLSGAMMLLMLALPGAVLLRKPTPSPA